MASSHSIWNHNRKNQGNLAVRSDLKLNICVSMENKTVYTRRLLLRRCFRNGSKFSSKTQSLVSELAKKSGLSLYQQRKLRLAADGTTAPSKIERWGNGLPKLRSVMPVQPRHRSAPISFRRSSLSTTGKHSTSHALYFSNFELYFDCPHLQWMSVQQDEICWGCKTSSIR